MCIIERFPCFQFQNNCSSSLCLEMAFYTWSGCWLRTGISYLHHPPPHVGPDNIPVSKPNTEGVNIQPVSKTTAPVWRNLLDECARIIFLLVLIHNVIHNLGLDNILSRLLISLQMKLLKYEWRVCEISQQENKQVCTLIFCKILNKKNEANLIPVYNK